MGRGPVAWCCRVFCMFSHASFIGPAGKKGFGVFGGFPWVSGLVSYPPGPILESAFLWRCFCRQKPPCSGFVAGGKANKPLVSGICVVFWPWHPRPPKTTWLNNHLVVCWSCHRRRQGQQNARFLNMCCCSALAPQAFKNHLAKKQIRDPFECHTIPSKPGPRRI